MNLPRLLALLVPAVSAAVGFGVACGAAWFGASATLTLAVGCGAAAFVATFLAVATTAFAELQGW
jgi:hypothetical protein